MNAGMNDRDWELLSTYLDSSLSSGETRDVEDRLLTDPEFNAAYVSLRRTRAILRAVPDVKRRRNFFLSPNMVAQRKWTWLVPVFNYSSAAAGLMAAILLVMNLLPMGMKTAPAQQAQMPDPLLQVAAGPPNAMSESLPAATLVVDMNRDYSTQPGAVGEAETSADQAAAPADATGAGVEAPATVPNMFTGEEPAPAPLAAAPLMAKGGETPAEAAPAMDAASVIAPTPTAVMAMKAASEEKAEAPLVPVPTMTLAPTSVLPTETSAASGFTASAEETLPAVNTVTANRVMPEVVPVPSAGQPVETVRGFSTARLGGYLLLVSVILGAAGLYLRNRLK
jgi:hypothetical protein